MKEKNNSELEQSGTNPFVEDIIQNIKEQNPYGFILRPDLREKTGGLLHGKTMANMDSLGKGIENRFLIGRVTAYPIESIIEFLRKKIIVVPVSVNPCRSKGHRVTQRFCSER